MAAACGMAVDAAAIINPCSISGDAGFTPAHPGHDDRIGVFVGTYGANFISGPTVTYYKATVSAPNRIDVDTIVSNSDTTVFPGYRQVQPRDFDYVFGYFGPLDAGDHTVVSTLHVYDSKVGTLALACDPRTVTLAVSTQPGPTATAPVVEYYNATLDHYFITQFPAEAAMLDAGTQWRRTGESFPMYLPGQSDLRGRAAARYYGAPSAGLHSHFFTWSQAERDAITTGPLGHAWQFETSDAFEAVVPNWPGGDCPAATTPVYRLWNDRSDSAHRYTTNPAIRQAMLEQGYVAEGYGPDVVFMCAPL